MAELKHIDPMSALKVGFVAFAMLGFVAGLLCATIALSGVPFAPHAGLPIAGALLALVALFACPILYGIFGSILTLLAALFYNLGAGMAGGLKLDVN